MSPESRCHTGREQCHAACLKRDIICHPSRCSSRCSSRCPSRSFGTRPRKALECHAERVGRSDTSSGSLPLFTGRCSGTAHRSRARPGVKRIARPRTFRRGMATLPQRRNTVECRMSKDPMRMSVVEQPENRCSTAGQQQCNKIGRQAWHGHGHQVSE